MRMPLLLADFIHHRVCEPICEKSLTLPGMTLPEAIAARRFLGIFSLHRNRADMISCFLSFKSSVPSKRKQGIFFLI